MVELVLVFSLGVLVAGVAWLLALPAFWRRAVRLTRDRIERQLPLSLNEIEAEQDRLRASHAVALAREFQARQRADDAVAAAKGETGNRLWVEADLLERIKQFEVLLAARDQDAARLGTEINAHEGKITELLDAAALARMSIVGLETERDAMRARFDALTETAEKRRIALDEAEVHAARAREALAEETRRGGALMLEVQRLSNAVQDAERRLEDASRQGIGARPREGERADGGIQLAADLSRSS